MAESIPYVSAYVRYQAKNYEGVGVTSFDSSIGKGKPVTLTQLVYAIFSDALNLYCQVAKPSEEEINAEIQRLAAAIADTHMEKREQGGR